MEVPKEWKSAGSGEEEIDYILFDLVASAHSGSETLTFFNHNRSTSTLAVTNLELAGQLPATQRFLIKSIQLLVDVNAAAGDSADELDAAAAELFINNKSMFCAPAAIFSVPVSISTNRTAEVGGAVNMTGFELDKGLVLQGGVPFKLVMLNGKTASSANTDHTFMLRGRLVRPSG
jgi:hypothetical protein